MRNLNLPPPSRKRRPISAGRLRDDLVTFCVDETEEAFDYYLQHENGNPLVYDTVSVSMTNTALSPRCPSSARDVPHVRQIDQTDHDLDHLDTNLPL